jgi:hypothetical protein
MKILAFGSLNIDPASSADPIVRPGEAAGGGSLRKNAAACKAASRTGAMGATPFTGEAFV